MDTTIRPTLRARFAEYRPMLFGAVAALPFCIVLVAPLPAHKGTVWLKPETCAVLSARGTPIEALDGGSCGWVGKFNNRFQAMELYLDARLAVPYQQVLAYERKR